MILFLLLAAWVVSAFLRGLWLAVVIAAALVYLLVRYCTALYVFVRWHRRQRAWS